MIIKYLARFRTNNGDNSKFYDYYHDEKWRIVEKRWDMHEKEEHIVREIPDTIEGYVRTIVPLSKDMNCISLLHIIIKKSSHLNILGSEHIVENSYTKYYHTSYGRIAREDCDIVRSWTLEI